MIKGQALAIAARLVGSVLVRLRAACAASVARLMPRRRSPPARPRPPCVECQILPEFALKTTASGSGRALAMRLDVAVKISSLISSLLRLVSEQSPGPQVASTKLHEETLHEPDAGGSQRRLLWSFDGCSPRLTTGGADGVSPANEVYVQGDELRLGVAINLSLDDLVGSLSAANVSASTGDSASLPEEAVCEDAQQRIALVAQLAKRRFDLQKGIYALVEQRPDIALTEIEGAWHTKHGEPMPLESSGYGHNISRAVGDVQGLLVTVTRDGPSRVRLSSSSVGTGWVRGSSLSSRGLRNRSLGLPPGATTELARQAADGVYYTWPEFRQWYGFLDARSMWAAAAEGLDKKT